MTFTIRKNYMVRLEKVKGFPDLEVIYESNEDNFLKIAKKIKRKFGKEISIGIIFKEIYVPGSSPSHIWETIKGTDNL